MDNIIPQELPANITSIASSAMQTTVTTADGRVFVTSNSDLYFKILEVYEQNRSKTEWQGELGAPPWAGGTFYCDADKVIVESNGHQRVTTGQAMISEIFGVYEKMRSKVFWGE